ncbi:coiled-coil domain-containing protein 86 [Vulpes vulpes]|uniref:Coiled-coil domain-containing protein 86 n=1 Tax=Vulpes vulpes TaxID=9627 RepID=A0A3Q7RLR6_VULVU|nr:coiled-coil domain-containing protein 86 [Vulpes vulpes]
MDTPPRRSPRLGGLSPGAPDGAGAGLRARRAPAELEPDPAGTREPGPPRRVRRPEPEPGPGSPVRRGGAPGSPRGPGPQLPHTLPESAPEAPGCPPAPGGASAESSRARGLDSEPAPGPPRHQLRPGSPEPPPGQQAPGPEPSRPPREPTARPPGSPRGQHEPSRPAAATETGRSDLGAKKRTSPSVQAAASRRLKAVEEVPAVPKGKPKSGRLWKDRSKERFSQMVQGKPLHTSWQQKMKERQERKLAKDFARHLEEEKEKCQQEKKQRRAENLKRRLENERRAEVVQVIRNPAKLKRAKKKQLRSIQKRDTLALLQKQPSQQPAAKI